MAIAAQCSFWYYTSPTLPLHRRHGLLRRRLPEAARRGRWPRLQLQVAAAAAGGARAEDSIKAATDSEFFQPFDTRPIMLFDGVCNLCNGGVRFVREHDPNRSIRYVPLQSESGRKLLQRSGRSPDDISSVVLVEKDRSYIKSEAVLRIMEYLNLPFPQLAIFFKFVPRISQGPDGRSPSPLRLCPGEDVGLEGNWDLLGTPLRDAAPAATTSKEDGPRRYYYFHSATTSRRDAGNLQSVHDPPFGS